MWGVKTFRASRFLQNAAVLTATSLLLRVVGIFFRIYLSNRIGAEGMGLYQLVISVYTLASAFAAAGICTAVTRLVTDSLCKGDRATALTALRKSVWLSVAVGVVSAALLVAAADPVARLFLKDVRAIPALRVLTASLPFMGVSSCLKGYFTARRRVSVTARAQILEQAVRISVIVWLLPRVQGADITAACAVVMVGDVVAETVACLRLSLGFAWDKRGLPPAISPAKSRLMAEIMGIALPISATRYLTTALHAAENMLVPAKLTVYTASRTVALSQFGCLKGMAMPLLFFPASFLSAIGTLLIPEISEASALGKRTQVQEAVGRVIHITLTASVLIGGVFYLYADEFGMLFYKSREVGRILRALAPLVPAMYLESITDGILKGLGQQVSTLRHNVVDSALRISLTLLLVPRHGMAGFLFVMTVSNILVAVLNLHHLLRVTDMPILWRRWFLGPLAAVGVSIFAARSLGRVAAVAVLPAPVSLCCGAALLCAVYALLLFSMGCVTRRDFRVR